MYSFTKGPQLVNGRIVDEEGNPIPGVNIFTKGSTAGTVSDANGNYSLNLPEGKNIVIFQALGMQTIEKVIYKQETDVQMDSDTKLLSEMVMSGYGVESSKNTKNLEKKKDKPANQNLEINEQVNQLDVTFEIETPYTILNDGKSYTVDIKEHDLPAIYEYY